MEANGLILKRNIPSTVTLLGELKETSLLQNLETYFPNKSDVVVWLDYEVRIGSWNKGFEFFEGNALPFEHIQRLRVFNEDSELHMWRSRGSWFSRIREDEKGDTQTDIVVAKQILFGTEIKHLEDGYTQISEERGTKLTLPFTNLTVDNQINRISIQTHNYIDYNQAHQASYVDCRFVAFFNNERCLSERNS